MDDPISSSHSAVPRQLRLAGAGTPGGAGALALVPLPTGTDVDYQLGGDRSVPDHVGIVVRDRESEPVEGTYNVCYVNGFQTQPNERAFWRQHWRLVLKDDGKPVTDEAWGEWLLDTRTAAKRRELARIVGRWIGGCAADGFDAVEFDNLDSFTRSHGLVERRQALAFARLLVDGAHDAGLEAGQKNLAGTTAPRIGFDFAVAEECGRYHECGAYVDALRRPGAGDRVPPRGTSAGPARTSATSSPSCSVTAT